MSERCAQHDEQREIYQESAPTTPIVEHADVVVCGGGPAGVAAALAAARTGASVRLIEAHGQLGGVWTTGLLSCIIDAGDKHGVMQQILNRLEACGGRPAQSSSGSFTYDPEQMKLMLERACIEAGVRVRLHTRVAAAGRDADNRLSVVITESKSGREAFAGKVFIDATGDGDLAARTGCGFDMGRDSDGATQPMSLMALLTGVRWSELHALGVVRGEHTSAREAKDMLRRILQDAGCPPSYSDPTLFPIHENVLAMMANHEYGVSALDAQQITDATLRARSELNEIVEALRSIGGAWAELRLAATGSQIGVREGRRIHGRYTVTVDDLLEGRRHDDAVCRVNFGIDVHSITRAAGGGVEKTPKKEKAQPYDIPYRALIAKDVDGLLLAGRCISGDFLAHASYRVTGNAVAMGEAAGCAAAVAARHDRSPHQLDYHRDVQPAQQAIHHAIAATMATST